MVAVSANLVPLAIPICTTSSALYIVEEEASIDLSWAILASQELMESIRRARKTAREGGKWLTYEQVFGE